MRRDTAVLKPLGRSLFLVALLAIFTMAACDTKKPAPRQQQVRQVSILTVHTMKIMESTELPGRTSAFRVAEIRPQVNGLIQKRLFEEGSDVKAGQVLYQIDPAPFHAALDNAKAALGRAKANLPSLRSKAKRYKSLLADKAVSQQDYDDTAAALAQIEADIKYYKASVQTAQINLGYTKVTAPISGRIGKSNVTAGAIVTAYQPAALATIHQLDPIYVDVPQSTTQLLLWKRRLQSGCLNRSGAEQNQVRLILEDGTPYPEKGTLQFRDITVDPTTGSVILRMVFPNPNGMLLPAMFVRAVVNEGVNDHAILVPQQAVSRNHRGEPLAMIVDANNKVAVRMLTIDRAVGNKWLVSSGLKTGDKVIMEGAQMLRPGTVVKSVPFNKNKMPPAKAAKQTAASK